MTVILVIEDEPQVRRNIQEILELSGFAVYVASSGAQGLRCAFEILPDLIISDIVMPELDGYGVFQALQAEESTARIPFIFLTAKASRQDWRTAMNMGVDDYLIKPFTPQELLDAIETRLRRTDHLTRPYKTQLAETAAHLCYVSCHDSLTQLLNNQGLQQVFGLWQIQGKAMPNLMHPASDRPSTVLSSFATGYLLLLQIQNWPSLESLLGQTLSQEILQQVAAQIQGYTHAPLASNDRACNLYRSLDSSVLDPANPLPPFAQLDTPPVASLGQGRFAILRAGQLPVAAVTEFVEGLIDRLQRPLYCGEDAEHEVVLRPIVGLSQWPMDSQTLDGLLSCGEVALAQCQPPNPRQYCFYDPQDRRSGLRALRLTTQLHHALNQSQLQVYYQPQIDLNSGQCIGAEALVRWQLPEVGFISPAEFIPLAEETGLIVDLGRWILREACRSAQAWSAHCSAPIAPKVSVNLSPRQFYASNLIQDIEAALTETNLAPQRLVLEVTESLVFVDPMVALETMATLRDLGLKIAIDDFGIGYSSLSVLQQFPFKILKIDQSFVRGLMENTTTQAITQFIIQMAQKLQLQLVAEGVETQAELVYLQEHGCGVVQGYYFSPPLPLAEFQRQFLPGGGDEAGNGLG